MGGRGSLASWKRLLQDWSDCGRAHGPEMAVRNLLDAGGEVFDLASVGVAILVDVMKVNVRVGDGALAQVVSIIVGCSDPKPAGHRARAAFRRGRRDG